MQTLDESNAALRQAVETRLAGSCCEGDKNHKAYGVESLTTTTTSEFVACSEPRHSPLRPGSEAFVAVLEEVKRLHLKKTLDYGADEDALANIRSSSDVVNMPAWAGCILRISDKMHRLRSFFRRGVVEFDGIEDTLLDICSYAAIALVLYREMISRARK